MPLLHRLSNNAIHQLVSTHSSPFFHFHIIEGLWTNILYAPTIDITYLRYATQLDLLLAGYKQRRCDGSDTSFERYGHPELAALCRK